MNLISMKSCIVLLIIVVSNSIADDHNWTGETKIARRIKRINQELIRLKQVSISSRESCETVMNKNCEKTSWKSKLLMYKEEGFNQIEKSTELYVIILIGIVSIILVFYFHIVHPERYLSLSSVYIDHQLWNNVSLDVDMV